MENKQEELKSAEEILEKWYQIYRDTPLFSRFDADIKAMEEYADQFKKQLKEKEQESIMLEKMCNRAQDHAEQLLKQLTKSNEMIDRLAEALDIFNRADANSGLQTSILKHNELIFIRKALTEYQNSKK